jgi:hypothetical protein
MEFQSNPWMIFSMSHNYQNVHSFILTMEVAHMKEVNVNMCIWV